MTSQNPSVDTARIVTQAGRRTKLWGGMLFVLGLAHILALAPLQLFEASFGTVAFQGVAGLTAVVAGILLWRAGGALCRASQSLSAEGLAAGVAAVGKACLVQVWASVLGVVLFGAFFAAGIASSRIYSSF